MGFAPASLWLHLILFLLISFPLDSSAASSSGQNLSHESNSQRRCSPRTSTRSSPRYTETFEEGNTVTRQAFFELYRDIKVMAIQQLRLRSNKITLEDWEIENWPRFVPYHPKNWDQQAFRAVMAVQHQLKFKHKTALSPVDDSRTVRRRQLLDEIVAIFNAQTGKAGKRVEWTRYHLEGWPRGVSLRSDRFNSSEILKLSRCLHKIKFIPIVGNERRRISYIDDDESNDDNIASNDDKDENSEITVDDQDTSNDDTDEPSYSHVINVEAHPSSSSDDFTYLGFDFTAEEDHEEPIEKLFAMFSSAPLVGGDDFVKYLEDYDPEFDSYLTIDDI